MTKARPVPSTVRVGILTAPTITVCLHGRWVCDGNPCAPEEDIVISRPCELTPSANDCTFTLRRVVIGKQYHWQQLQDQTFRGSLKIIRDGEALTAVNIIGIEEYLKSVVSSEMSAEASIEFLKASAVISRSWLVRQIMGNQAHRQASAQTPAKIAQTQPQSLQLQSQLPPPETPDTIIRWEDHTAHTLYDVCADDHCQRYQGITAITNEKAVKAVCDTEGQVLTYDGEVCDCRFSKCCGGHTEEFATCWQDEDVPYLHSIADTDPRDGSILCDTKDEAVLKQVMKDYDLLTTDFFRWERRYSQTEISSLIEKKLHRGLGHILQLIPLRRGPSGRISMLEIQGTNGTIKIGKELLIRETLSESHLLSSAFEVETLNSNALEHSTDIAATQAPESLKPNADIAVTQDSATAQMADARTIPAGFILKGRGWGHGVGMCQIGAAVMGSRGYDYKTILQHYYPNTVLAFSNSQIPAK